MALPTKTLTIHIASSSLTYLKGAGYKLCIARMLGDGRFNVVWEGKDRLLNTNVFKWQDSFRVYGVETFSNGALVQASNDPQVIQLGESCTFDEAGVNHTATGSSTADATAFYVHNEFGRIHIAVEALVQSTNGPVYQPFYVSSDAEAMGTIALTPIEKIMVFMHKTLSTSSMFTEVISNAITLDYSGVTDLQVQYTDKDQWLKVDDKGKITEIMVPVRYGVGGMMKVGGTGGQNFVPLVAQFQPPVYNIALQAALGAYLAYKGYKVVKWTPEVLEFSMEVPSKKAALALLADDDDYAAEAQKALDDFRLLYPDEESVVVKKKVSTP